MPGIGICRHNSDLFHIARPSASRYVFVYKKGAIENVWCSTLQYLSTSICFIKKIISIPVILYTTSMSEKIARFG